MSTIKAVLFDLDDTLWPLMPVILRAETVLHEWLAIHAPGVTQRFTIESLRDMRAQRQAQDPRYLIDMWGLRHATLTEACELCGENAALMEQAMLVFSDARNQVTPFDDVTPALDSLGQRYMLGSISNGFADLEAIGLAHHFKSSVAAHKFGRGKPDVAIFHAACDALRVDPHEAVYVGDDLTLDVEGAQKAGLRAVWMNRFDRVAPPHVTPDAICTTLHEVEQWLKSPASERIMTPDPAD